MKVSPGTISNHNMKDLREDRGMRNHPIDDSFQYVYLEGIMLKRSWVREVSNVLVLVAIGVNSERHRKVLGICMGPRKTRPAGRDSLAI
jgi:transposase-like protein